MNKSLDKLSKGELIELLTGKTKELTEKEVLKLSANPKLFWWEFTGDYENGYDNFCCDVQYKGERYHAIFKIIN